MYTHCNLHCLLKKTSLQLLFFRILFLDDLVIAANTLALVRSPEHYTLIHFIVVYFLILCVQINLFHSHSHSHSHSHITYATI